MVASLLRRALSLQCSSLSQQKTGRVLFSGSSRTEGCLDWGPQAQLKTRKEPEWKQYSRWVRTEWRSLSPTISFRHPESWQPIFHPPERSLEKFSLGILPAQEKIPQDIDIRSSPTKEPTQISQVNSKQMPLTYSELLSSFSVHHS